MWPIAIRVCMREAGSPTDDKTCTWPRSLLLGGTNIEIAKQP